MKRLFGKHKLSLALVALVIVSVIGIILIDHEASSHLQDLWVIFLADLAAGYIGFLAYENSQKDKNRESALAAMSVLSPIYRGVQAWAGRAIHSPGAIAFGEEQWMRDIQKLRNDFLVWNFPGSKPFRQLTNKLYNNWTQVQGQAGGTTGAPPRTFFVRIERLQTQAAEGIQLIRNLRDSLEPGEVEDEEFVS